MNEQNVHTPSLDILEQAELRLNRAVKSLTTNIERVAERLEASKPAEREAEALRRDRARLALDLDNARARERELQMLADEASTALGAAIQEVREALGKV
ncbi:DUF4164 family protein [Hirschia litorea]|uniref:DUF4164 family protein n=1 Tax=Hirschia litorea TaxID=1199156 RepID=A0ABW2IMV5_9PROT